MNENVAKFGEKLTTREARRIQELKNCGLDAEQLKHLLSEKALEISEAHARLLRLYHNLDGKGIHTINQIRELLGYRDNSAVNSALNKAHRRLIEIQNKNQ